MALARFRSSRRAATAASLLSVVSASGCGFILTQSPPADHERLDYFTCTESNAGPIIDIIWGSLNVVGTLVVAADPGNYRNSESAIVGGVLWGVLSGSSAVVGFGKTRRCREAKLLFAQRQGLGAQPAGDLTVQAVVVRAAADTLSVGERLQLLATAHDAAGGAIPDRAFVWSSSNDAIASVGAAGLVTAHAPGSVVIAARTGSIVGTARITVRAPDQEPFSSRDRPRRAP